MKSEQEIKEIYRKCVESKGYISPSVVEALELILELEGAESLQRQLDEMVTCVCGHWRLTHSYDGENHTGVCNESHVALGVRIYCQCEEFKEK